MRNACIYLVNKHGYLMMLKCRKTHQWMTPGGKIERYETPWSCAVREFKEETNYDLPLHRCKLMYRSNWKDTMVYVIELNHRFPERFVPTNEAIGRNYIHLSEIPKNRNIKKYVKDSFHDLDIVSIVWTSRQF